ncbi:CAP domain-containing protein [Fodinicola acaciae]|uniref:CAP domain-containing protein n=1 Tax=Fodinicola acaciae TaxID=2681555 RepID=UPI001C9E8D43|nr:CAP domain-containing protein [Fodinicola acaciae]
MKASRVIFACLLAGATGAASLTAVAVSPAYAAVSYAQQVVDLTNQQRRSHGCGNLTVNAALTRSAQGHSADMAAHNYFAHNSQNGKTPGARITSAGYSWSRWAENIAAGYQTPAQVVNGWMNSSGHRANILNCKLRDIGVGYVYSGAAKYRTYWTQDFGTRR